MFFFITLFHPGEISCFYHKDKDRSIEGREMFSLHLRGSIRLEDEICRNLHLLIFFEIFNLNFAKINWFHITGYHSWYLKTIEFTLIFIR